MQTTSNPGPAVSPSARLLSPRRKTTEATTATTASIPPTTHPFFVGTLFQPERAALRGETPPLVAAFVRAIANSQKIYRG